MRWWQLPVVLALGVLAAVALGPVVATIPALYVAATAPELTRIDLAEHRLPNRLVVPGLGVGLLAGAGSWATTGVPPVVPLLAAVGYGGLLFLFALGGGMGMGDVKLAAVLGLASPTATVAVASRPRCWRSSWAASPGWSCSSCAGPAAASRSGRSSSRAMRAHFSRRSP